MSPPGGVEASYWPRSRRLGEIGLTPENSKLVMGNLEQNFENNCKVGWVLEKNWREIGEDLERRNCDDVSIDQLLYEAAGTSETLSRA